MLWLTWREDDDRMTVDDPKVSVQSMLCGTGNSLRSATDVTNCLRKREKEGINQCGCLFVQGWVGIRKMAWWMGFL